MKPCSVEECPTPATYKDFCQKHYKRNKLHGDPRIRGRKGPLPKGRQCCLEDCTQPHRAQGYCTKHYKRLMSTGDPEGLSTYMTEPRGNNSYGSMHRSLRDWFGQAAQHTCLCGSPASQWSYDHEDPEEIWHEMPDQRGDIRTVPWSKKFEHYQPLCGPCHLTRDRNYK